MTAEKFKSICEEKGITWNDLVRIRVIKPKKFLGFFRQLTGITIDSRRRPGSSYEIYQGGLSV